jgi:hypothetical protein
VLAAVLEAQPGADDEVLDRARHEHLAGRGRLFDACGDVHADAAQVVAEDLALAGVDADPELDAELRRRGVAQREGRAPRSPPCAYRTGLQLDT